MTDEIKKTDEEKCFCKSKGFRKFLIVAGGTFVGVFCALSLFAALHKPPMMQPVPYGGAMMRPCPCHCQHHFDRGDRGDRGNCHKKHIKTDFGKNSEQPAPQRVQTH